jgi:hypothetical protein
MGDSTFQITKEMENGQATSTPREIVMKYLHYMPWFSISIAIFLIGAYLKLRYSPRIYQVAGNILVKDPSRNSAGGDKFDNLLLMQPNKNINDEIQVIRSRSMAQRVVRALGYETQYIIVGKIVTGVLYSKESPVVLEILKLKDSTVGLNLPIFIQNDQQFSFTEKGQPMSFGQPFENKDGLFRLSRTTANLNAFASRQFVITHQSAELRAREFVGNLSVSQSGDATNILSLTGQCCI